MRFLIIAALVLSACAKTSVTDVSQTQFLLNTSAAPACGRAGASQVASKMAAIETLRRGYPRYVILGAGSGNNTRVLPGTPISSTTNATFNTYGNTTYGSARTTYTNTGPIIAGSFDAQLAVQMLSPSDPNFNNGVDAKRVLGPDWQTLVEKGLNTCS